MKGRSSLIKIGMVLLSLALCLGLTGLGGAQEKYPAREITVITGNAPGEGAEIILRAHCSAVSKILGQPIIVLNKPGAGHALATLAVMNAKPDGYTLGDLRSGAASTQIVQKVSYDFLKDFTFIMQCQGYQHGIVVQTGAPWKTIQEFIAYIKSNPGKVRVGVLQVGSAHHIVMERLSAKIGGGFNIIPLGNNPTVLTNLLGGHVEAGCMSSAFLPNVEAGQIRLLAVMGGAEKRMAQFPDIPTLMELYGINMPGFTVIAGPKGLPPHVVDTLHKVFKETLEDPAVIELSKKYGYPIIYRGPEDITKEIHAFFDTLTPVIKTLKLRKE